MLTSKTSKNTLSKKKANGLLEYMFLEKFELLGLSICLTSFKISHGRPFIPRLSGLVANESHFTNFIIFLQQHNY